MSSAVWPVPEKALKPATSFVFRLEGKGWTQTEQNVLLRLPKPRTPQSLSDEVQAMQRDLLAPLGRLPFLFLLLLPPSLPSSRSQAEKAESNRRVGPGVQLQPWSLSRREWLLRPRLYPLLPPPPDQWLLSLGPDLSQKILDHHLWKRTCNCPGSPAEALPVPS